MVLVGRVLVSACSVPACNCTSVSSNATPHSQTEIAASKEHEVSKVPFARFEQLLQNQLRHITEFPFVIFCFVFDISFANNISRKSAAQPPDVVSERMPFRRKPHGTRIGCYSLLCTVVLVQNCVFSNSLPEVPCTSFWPHQLALPYLLPLRLPDLSVSELCP